MDIESAARTNPIVWVDWNAVTELVEVRSLSLSKCGKLVGKETRTRNLSQRREGAKGWLIWGCNAIHGCALCHSEWAQRLEDGSRNLKDWHNSALKCVYPQGGGRMQYAPTRLLKSAVAEWQQLIFYHYFLCVLCAFSVHFAATPQLRSGTELQGIPIPWISYSCSIFKRRFWQNGATPASQEEG